MRAIWKGHIRFSLVTIPVRIYSAIEAGQIVRFNQLHNEDFGRIGYTKTCKKCDEVVKSDEIVKGYEYEPDKYVIIEKEDFAKLRLKSTRIIEIEGFVDAEEVDPTLYDSPYYAGPDGPVAAKAYGLLRETLKATGKMGIGRVVLRDKESIMMLTARDEGLLLYKLRFPNEVRKVEDIPQLDDVSAEKDQLKLAHTLVDSMSTTFAELELEDRYRSALIEMVQAKVAGEEIITVEEEEAPVIDIMTALKQSIDQAKESKKPMKKATADKAKSKAKGTAKKTGS
ncbi:MAG: Ku protein [Rhodothermales bacterium]|nr:Ku protein [Rhodothermales bacterium]